MSEALDVAAEAEAHPHDLRAAIPDRLPAAVVRGLSVLDARKALAALATEWVLVAAAIGVAVALEGTRAWPWVYPLVVVFVGARQAALTVIGHDASHYRFLPSRFWNDVVGDALVQWPTFITVEGFRKFHGEHHQHLGEPGDGNRKLWRTHDAEGNLTREWTYPKSPAAFAAKILWRGALLTGALWIVRGTIGAFLFRASNAHLVLRVVWLAAVVGALTAADAWMGFLLYWVVPYCTWHMVAQYVRLVCEHSNVPSDDPAYGATRTTLARPWERWLLVPRNIAYHIEHHWYPSVPFYNLPALHEALMAQPGFRARAVVTDSIVASVRQALTPRAAS